MSTAPRFCGSCGAGLTPGAAFCGGCGSRVAAAAQPAAAPEPVPQPQPVAAAPAYQPPPPYQPEAPQPQYQPAPAAPPAGHRYPDWNSVEVQPGEVPLGSWMVALQARGSDYTGSLTVTDRRVLFKPKVAGTSLLGMLISQLPSAKARNTVVLGKDQIVDVRAEKGIINTSVLVTIADGAVIAFTRGVMSADPIVAAIRQR